MRKNAFTLIEVMTVVGILFLLAAIAIPNFVRAHWDAEQPTRNLAHLMAVEGISSDKPINLGFGWYYLSSAVTNSSDAIASLVKDSGRSVVHTFPAEIHGNYGDSDIGSMIKTIADELAITNGYFVAIAIKELN